MKQTQARKEARELVQNLRRSNRKAERSGAPKLPDDEYNALEDELTNKLLQRAA